MHRIMPPPKKKKKKKKFKRILFKKNSTLWDLIFTFSFFVFFFFLFSFCLISSLIPAFPLLNDCCLALRNYLNSIRVRFNISWMTFFSPTFMSYVWGNPTYLFTTHASRCLFFVIFVVIDGFGLWGGA